MPASAGCIHPQLANVRSKCRPEHRAHEPLRARDRRRNRLQLLHDLWSTTPTARSGSVVLDTTGRPAVSIDPARRRRGTWLCLGSCDWHLLLGVPETIGLTGPSQRARPVAVDATTIEDAGWQPAFDQTADDVRRHNARFSSPPPRQDELEKPRAYSSGCSSCATGKLCDRDHCVAPGRGGSAYVGGTFGGRCDPNPPNPQMRAVCGTYRCIDERCQSCRTDQDCCTGFPDCTPGIAGATSCACTGARPDAMNAGFQTYSCARASRLREMPTTHRSTVNGLLPDYRGDGRHRSRAYWQERADRSVRRSAGTCGRS